jgi:PPOX class probable F420-dependent enzyme
MEQLNEKSIAILKGKNFAYIATVSPNGAPQVTPVWIDMDGKNILVNTAIGRAKEKNLTRDPRVAISVHDAANPYSMVSLNGKVIDKITGKKADDHIDSLSLKYTGNPVYQGRTAAEHRVILVIQPTRIRRQQ